MFPPLFYKPLKFGIETHKRCIQNYEHNRAVNSLACLRLLAAVVFVSVNIAARVFKTPLVYGVAAVIDNVAFKVAF
jgi:hypothetical protein